MHPDDLKFIHTNIIHFEAARLGFTRNVPYEILQGYEAIYKKYLDPHFILTYWCGACVLDMLKRLVVWYDRHMMTTSYGETQPIEIKKDDC